jgi:hypothetical protein
VHVRALSPVLSIVLASCGATACAAELEVRVVRNGQAVVVSQVQSLASKLVSLAESSSVNSTAYAVAADTWAQSLASDSYVHVVFPSPRTLRLKVHNNEVQQPLLVSELLLPLPKGRWPAHLLAQAAGTTIALTKFDPPVFKTLLVEPELQLSAVPPYSSLAGPQRAK